MQLALKSPAIEVGVWFVIFHSKLPHDFGSGGVKDIEVQTPTASGEKPPGPLVGMTTSRADSNPQAAARSDAAAIPAIGWILRTIVQFLIGRGGMADYKIGRRHTIMYAATEKIAVFPRIQSYLETGCRRPAR
jgi:hypothetical protein